MTKELSEIGIAVSCDHAGIILNVIRCDIPLEHAIIKKSPFSDLFFAGSKEKAELFLQKIQIDGAAFDWELSVLCTHDVRSLHFTGGRSQNEVVIVGSARRMELVTLSQDLMVINNEQMNALRSAIKELSLHQGKTEKTENQLFDELTKVNNDLTNLQRELVKKNFELKKLNDDKNKFLGMAAHDLRNPLGAIFSYSDFLREEAKDSLSAEHREFVDIIHSSSQFMLNMVSELLDISTIESGKLTLDLQLVNIVELIDHNVKINKILAEKKKIGILVNYEDHLPPVELDRMKFDQVLNNLLTNAVKFSHSDSTIHINVSTDDTSIIISVRDEGQGIPQNEVDKLFTPYSMTSTKSTGGEQSTGLGLAIVKRVVEGHHGTIAVTSNVGVGTIFVVRMPLLQRSIS